MLKACSLIHHHGLHRLLGALFLSEMPVKEKNEVLEEEFHIEMETAGYRIPAKV